ncbi:MAG: potassium-transporting ATPase subunit KdpC [Pirellulaceae bacterium]
MLQQCRTSIIVLGLMTLLTGVVYPCLVTAFAQWAFPRRANGSILQVNGEPVGSELIGQSFSQPGYFWGRLSATSPFSYNAAASSGSNYGPLHPELKKKANARIDALRKFELGTGTIPVDLVTSSGSGLDPHISLAAAQVQVHRVATARMMPEEHVRGLVQRHLEPRQLGVLGEPRINVLRLNLALDAVSKRN